MRASDRLDALYAELPHIECQRVCQECCGPIGMGVHEMRRIEALTTRPLQMVDAELTCAYLEGDACSVYEARPLICRLWGLVDRDGMRCPYGCVPDRWLTDTEARSLVDRARAISGGNVVFTTPDIAATLRKALP